ncbi:diphthine synthase [Cichlidogyrus casuarinus]|uniref:Diphthine synthase n=1 Tax=Cichlidogyrus casuarinus TaxID=1844966 RepID=A0ABD2QD15_9PLAT
MFIEKDYIDADRKIVEQGVDILSSAKDAVVAFVVIGDPLSATTHVGKYNYSTLNHAKDLVQRAILENIPFEVINNTSIMTAAGLTGLCLYEFGRTVSIPLWDEFGEVTSFYKKIESNLKIGCHTLCLLDIKVKEQSLENLLKGNDIYEPARFMTCETAVRQIVTISKREKTPLISDSHLAIGLARMGSSEQRMAIGTISTFYKIGQGRPTKLVTFLGRPLHSLIILGPLQASEMEYLMLSVTNLQSDVHQPVFFVDSEKISEPSDKLTIERIMMDHNSKCKEIVDEMNEKIECPEKLEVEEEKDECVAGNPTYVPRIL